MQTMRETGVVSAGRMRPQLNWVSSQVTQWLQGDQVKNTLLKTSLSPSNVVKSQLWCGHALLTIESSQ